MKTSLLSAPADQLSNDLKEMISSWEDHPSSIDVITAIDAILLGQTASTYIVKSLLIMLDIAMKRERITFGQLTSHLNDIQK